MATKKAERVNDSGAIVQRITTSILFLRNERVLLDSELARLYGVDTKALNRAVRRNVARFPRDFVFELTDEEHTDLRYQFGTSSSGHGGRRHRPLVFTEHGAIMAASVLSSPRAVAVSVLVVRAFVRIRRVLSSHREIASKLTELERKYDARFREVFDALRVLLLAEDGPEEPARRIGFRHASTRRRSDDEGRCGRRGGMADTPLTVSSSRRASAPARRGRARSGSAGRSSSA